MRETRLDPTRCAERVYNNWSFSQCSRKPVNQEEGKGWCTQHTPSLVKDLFVRQPEPFGPNCFIGLANSVEDGSLDLAAKGAKKILVLDLEPHQFIRRYGALRGRQDVPNQL